MEGCSQAVALSRSDAFAFELSRVCPTVRKFVLSFLLGGGTESPWVVSTFGCFSSLL